VLTGSINPPAKIANNIPSKVDFSKDNFFTKYVNTSVSGETSIEKIVLFDSGTGAMTGT